MDKAVTTRKPARLASAKAKPRASIVVRGARQNNLKNLTLEIPLHELVVVTGVSGSGKSSLVFDTLYAEGQRRYVETFSPYARQFLDRMDKPAVDRIDGIPPSIAIDQTNPVRTSRSTVGTMTELNDHLKLLFARAATLHCRNCGKPVRRDNAEGIYAEAMSRAAAAGDPRVYICFPVTVPKNFKETEVRALLEQQGYSRIHERHGDTLEVVQDRLRLGTAERARVMESIETALRVGRGRVNLHVVEDTASSTEDGPKSIDRWKYSSELHCAECDLSYRDPVPSLFSFNSPVGACDTCRGFGRIIGIDYGLVVPDETKTLAGGAVKPWQTKSNKECQDDLVKFAKKRGIPLDTPWYALSEEQRKWVIEGEGKWEKKVWYGARRFFEWLETKAYKMHVRVLLSRYRAYTPCTVCHGSRLKPDALLWRIDGRNVHDLMLLSLDKSRRFFESLKLPAPLDEAADLLLGEVRARFAYLCEVGLGYLTLDRQSRTLSGGEVQRINLTTALGTSLVNTLFVLDEPSIGLHPRDMQRVTQVMHRLRDAGNSLVVVEHDPQIMLAADRLLDLGPGAGERGGEIVAFDTPDAIRANPKSLTGQYLSGSKIVAPRAPPPKPDNETRARMVPAQRAIKLRGVTQHNLKNIDVEFPLRRLVCITGVSGSGKSTLIEDVLYKALRKAKGQPSETPGAFDRLEGAEQVDDVVMIDQSSIGRTTRSNPASYVGAFDVVRELFASEPVARARKYTPGTFSFNSGTGRCPTCSGNGFEHVEMQFLSDVYLRCPDCDGSRYRAETLEIRREGADGTRKNIAQVLNMTVTEALAFFRGNSQVAVRLQPLVDVGLEYVKLGQPVPTLSGGEAQRLKLAGELAEAAADDTPSIRGKLFLFDEPTTGLHFDDVAKLLRAFRKLLKIGHSMLVIEHNLDVIRSADWLIDLGPEGGDAGGQIVVTGTPTEVEAHPHSHTGRALREYEAAFKTVPGRGSRGSGTPALKVAEPSLEPREPLPGTVFSAANSIVIHNAREHNLRNIDVTIPREAFTVITGVSGSGKSTLAFDIIFNEGQRRYLESLNAYARQFVQPAARPDVDAIYGIPPTVAIEQRTSRGGRKSTVATLTEIYHFLRLLYVKLGTQFCPTCDVAIQPQTSRSIAERLVKQHEGSRILLLAPLVVARKGFYTELAKWAHARGHKQLRVDGEMLSTVQWPRLNRFKEHTIELPVNQINVQKDSTDLLERNVIRALDMGKGLVHVLDLDSQAKKSRVQVFSIKRACPSCGTSFSELDPRLFSFNSKHGWCEDCFGTGLALEGFDEEQSGEETSWNEWLEGEAHACETCHGQRLNPVALHVRFRELNIADLTHQAIDETVSFIGKLRLNKREAEIARDLMAEIKSRMAFLQRVGLGYLPLDRSAPTLSGGEAQRIRLAAQLGSNLQGVCYVLDEPTIGLHPRDNKVLLDALAELAKHRNTLVVVEHDEDTIRRADHIIDLGPGAGVRGGEVVAAGTVDELRKNPASITGRFLENPLRHPIEPRRATSARTPQLALDQVDLHNVSKENISVPVGRLVVITGVSGSGKSTVARDVLYANLKRLTTKLPRGAAKPELTGVAAIRGVEHIDRVLEVDQTPIGKTPRSCPATYIGFWDDIRRIYANTTEAKIAGYTTSRFSFNTGEGRCPACEGQGMQTIEMNFLPDVKVLCDSCRGRRFNAATLSVLWRGKSVGDLLEMNIDDAVEFFTAHASIHHALRLLQDVGLGYLTLGQPSPTLSGGEAQRIKLVTELAKVRGEERRAPRQKQQHTLYVLDEPTVGLHMADVEKLIHVLHRLVDAGNTVVVIEHNLDVMAEADWIIDMGPEAGSGGGKVVVAGPPSAVVKVGASHTGVVLKEFLRDRRA
jgi:excinuclease ABC subunit A